MPTPGETLDHGIRKGIDTLGGVAEPIGQEATGVKVEALHRAGSNLGVFLLNRRPQQIDVEQHWVVIMTSAPRRAWSRTRRAFSAAIDDIGSDDIKSNTQFRIEAISKTNTIRETTGD